MTFLWLHHAECSIQSTDVYVYIYILLDTVLATDVNKYYLAFARCQPIWRTKFGERDLFLAAAKDWDVFLNKPITTKHQSVFWLVSQSRRMSAIFVGSRRWISLAAACADPMIQSLQVNVLHMMPVTFLFFWLQVLALSLDLSLMSEVLDVSLEGHVLGLALESICGTCGLLCMTVAE